MSADYTVSAGEGASQSHYADVGVVQMERRWRIHVRYDDGDVFISHDDFATREEAVAAVDTWVLENLQGTKQ